MNESQLLAQARESRCSWVELAGKRIRIEALSPGEFMRVISSKPVDVSEAMIDRAVVGWEGFTESDVIPNASDESLKFSPAVFRLWYDQTPEAWTPLFDAVWKACEGSRDRLNIITEKR